MENCNKNVIVLKSLFKIMNISLEYMNEEGYGEKGSMRGKWMDGKMLLSLIQLPHPSSSLAFAL